MVMSARRVRLDVRFVPREFFCGRQLLIDHELLERAEPMTVISGAEIGIPVAISASSKANSRMTREDCYSSRRCNPAAVHRPTSTMGMAIISVAMIAADGGCGCARGAKLIAATPPPRTRRGPGCGLR